MVVDRPLRGFSLRGPEQEVRPCAESSPRRPSPSPCSPGRRHPRRPSSGVDRALSGRIRGGPAGRPRRFRVRRRHVRPRPGPGLLLPRRRQHRPGHGRPHPLRAPRCRTARSWSTSSRPTNGTSSGCADAAVPRGAEPDRQSQPVLRQRAQRPVPGWRRPGPAEVTRAEAIQTWSVASTAQAVPVAGSSAASRSDQPPSGGPGSHRYHRRAAAAAPSSSGSNGQRSRPAGQRRHRPPGREPPVGHAPAAAVGAAARGRPGHDGEGVGGRDLGDAEVGSGPPRAATAAAASPTTATAATSPFDSCRHVMASSSSALVASRWSPSPPVAGAPAGGAGTAWPRSRLGHVGHLELVGPVGGEGVVGLPRLEPQRQLQHGGVDAVVAHEVVAPHDPLVGGHPGLGGPGNMGPQLGPGVGGGGHLGQRPEGEAAGAGHQHAGGLPSRRLQRQPVLGVAGDRPQLVPPLDRPAGTGPAGRRPRPSRGRRTDGRP